MDHPDEAKNAALSDPRFSFANRPASDANALAPRTASGSGIAGFQPPAVAAAMADPLFEKLQPIILELQQVHNQSHTKTREELQQAYDPLAPQVDALKPDANAPSPQRQRAMKVLAHTGDRRACCRSCGGC